MITLNHQIDVSASPDRVWAFVRDSSNAPRWFRGIAEARVEGNVRRMTLVNGTVVTEKIVTLDDVERRFQYSILDGLPAADHLGTIHVAEVGDSARILYTTVGDPDELIVALGRSVEKALATAKTILEHDEPRT